ncbi:toxin biosynthesis protein [Aspergillus ambiguus]|uniref:toxin biosynthesis protein n=1 Tax=Aspergillus ambiguus TaxID=176160 RepID=UPI003CCD253E
MAYSPFSITEHIVDCQYVREYPRATFPQAAPLKLLVKKYSPVDNLEPHPGDVTFVGVPGTGFPKELYEPLWEEIYARSHKEGFRIRAIWIADIANQGASGIHNEKYIGNDPSWFDHTRDLVHMINHFREEMPQPIMGIGHSLGGAQLRIVTRLFLSLYHPRLLSSLMLIEPFLHEKDRPGPWVLVRAVQRDAWPSRSEAIKASKRYLKGWDARVVDRWSQYGYRNLSSDANVPQGAEADGTVGVALATPISQEVLMYARPNSRRHKQLGLPSEEDDNEGESSSPPHDPLSVPDVLGPLYRHQRFYRPEPILAYKLLPHIRPPVLYVSGDKSELTQSGRQSAAAQKTGIGFGGSGGMEHNRVKHVIIQKSGHSVPMEKVGETADALSNWVSQQVQRWREDEQRILAGWGNQSAKKSALPLEWKAMMEISLPEKLRAKSAKL